MLDKETPGPTARLAAKALSVCFVGGFCLFPIVAAARLDNQRPIWEQAKALECHGSYRLVCSEGGCDRRLSQADWRVDFEHERIDFRGFDFSEQILSRSFAFLGEEIGSSHAIFFGSRIMLFDMDNAAFAGGDAVAARALHYEWRNPMGDDWESRDSVVETRFGCAPVY